MTYKRGTVVFINFGTSIGNELCGNHFGIVLSKNDSPSKGNLTVLPLTSKKKKYHLSLGNELIKNIFSDLFIQYKNFKKFTDTLHSSILDNDGHLKYIEGDKVEIKDEFITSYITNRIKRLPTDDGFVHYSSDEIAQLLKLIYREIDEIINFYKSKQTDSYGMIDSITTLSKYRIKKPLNYIDPIGRIRVSSETLEKVDIELIKKFTEFKINS